MRGEENETPEKEIDNRQIFMTSHVTLSSASRWMDDGSVTIRPTQMDRQIDGQVYGLIDGYKDGQIDRWMDGQKED